MAFKLEIDTSKKCFGETEHQKRAKICHLLQDVAQILGSGRAPQPLRVPTPGRPGGEIVGEYTID